jgi:hypothetical protein
MSREVETKIMWSQTQEKWTRETQFFFKNSLTLREKNFLPRNFFKTRSVKSFSNNFGWPIVDPLRCNFVFRCPIVSSWSSSGFDASQQWKCVKTKKGRPVWAPFFD